MGFQGYTNFTTDPVLVYSVSKFAYPEQEQPKFRQLFPSLDWEISVALAGGEGESHPMQKIIYNAIKHHYRDICKENTC